MARRLQHLIQFWDSRVGYGRSDHMKTFFKILASTIESSVLRRFLSYSVLKSQFDNLNKVQVLQNKEDVWDKALNLLECQAITYLEFGVYKGESISYFRAKNSHSDSMFVGLDSFEGLPKAWAGNSAGFFTTSGAIPALGDPRVAFIKGYFNETWDNLHSAILNRINIIVHFDADLYSSTLFALTKMDSLKQEYIAIFDEFSGDEVRVLSDYLISYGAEVSFLAVQKWRGFPEVVLCMISPLNSTQEIVKTLQL